jgi:hypothetical protein
LVSDTNIQHVRTSFVSVVTAAAVVELPHGQKSRRAL